MTLQIASRDARRLAIAAQRLAGPRRRPTRANALQVTREIGYLQLDPTNVVARNPLLVLWSRLGRYDQTLLEDLLVKRRALFETVSLIVPTSDLTIHSAAMKRHRGPHGIDAWGAQRRAKLREAWLRKNAALRRYVMGRLRREGPLPLTAFEDRAIVSWTSGGWNDARNVTMMLAILQRRGDVVVAGRQRGQKLWGIADGWLPKVRPLAPIALAREATLRALRALGVATFRQLRAQYAFGAHVTAEALASLEREGTVTRVEIADGDGAWKGPWYAPAGVGRRLRVLRDAWDGRTTLLSPFDNLIIDRARTEQLFGYRYRMEIYVPLHLRTLGYWAMPVLHGDKIVGSVDPKLDRTKGELVVNTVVLEPGAPRGVMKAIRGAVDELAEWLGATTVRWP